MWKDNSPGTHVHPHQKPPCDYYRSNPTSPNQQQGVQYVPRPHGFYGPHNPPRGGVPVFPPPQSPQVKRKNLATPTTPTGGDQRRRPMSFVRALEMSDSMEMAGPPNPAADNRGPQRGDTPNRSSVYDMNYEISV